MRDKFKSRLAVLHGRLYILYPEIDRKALIEKSGKSVEELASEPCFVDVRYDDL